MNKTILRIAFGATALLLVASTLQPVLAFCSPVAAPLSTRWTGGYSFIYQAGWGPNYGGTTYNGYPYDSFPAVDRASLFGVFWAIGSGDPGTAAGDDSGTFPVNDWIKSRDYPTTFYYAAEIYEYGTPIGWGTDDRINGCINASTTANGCTCVLLSQNGASGPQFAVFAAQQGALTAGATVFNRPSNAPIRMVSIPKPVVISSTRDNTTFDLTLEVQVPTPAAPGGVYELDGCDCNVQYLVKEFSAVRNTLGAPGTEDASQYGNLTDHTPTDLGTNAAGIRSLCGSSNVDVWLATQITVDAGATQGGWATPWVSDPTDLIQCGPTLADPVPKRRIPVQRPAERNTRSGRGGR